VTIKRESGRGGKAALEGYDRVVTSEVVGHIGRYVRERRAQEAARLLNSIGGPRPVEYVAESVPGARVWRWRVTAYQAKAVPR
jgi:hypothetical protein